MAVMAIFRYEVNPGRMEDFLAKLQEAASPKFHSAVMPKQIRLYRSSVPPPDTNSVILHIEYENMAAYGARTDFENANAKWRKLFTETPASPERVVSMELLTEFAS